MDLDGTLVTPRFGVPDFLTDGESVSFLHPTTGLAYGVNDTARAIWNALRSERSLEGISREIEREFDVSSDQSREAVGTFLTQMSELGLVELTKPGDPVSALRSRYLELLRRALANFIYPEHELRLEKLESRTVPTDPTTRDRELRDIRYRDADDFAQLMAAKRDGSVWRGRPWRFSHTMVGMRRLEHLQWCAERVFEDRVPGDFLEAGVCQGGASIFMRALQVAYDEPQRRMWVADSFQGLPEPVSEIDHGYDFSEAKQPWLAMTQAAVEDNFRTYDLLSDEVVFLPGWFSETLSAAPVSQLAILRLDADLYDSTRDALVALYDKVAPGGFIVVDDYNAFVPCRRAVDEFRTAHGIVEPIRRIDRMAVYWRRSL
jgi:O-methyltransferase